MNKILYTGVLLLFSLLPASLTAKTYYVNASLGHDQNKGTSQRKPLLSLEKVSQLKLHPGDRVLFAEGMVYRGSLEWHDLQGDPENPIIVGSYVANKNESGMAPLIDAKGFRNGILLVNCSHIVINDVMIMADGGGVPGGKIRRQDMRCGVLITTTEPGNYENITLKNLTIRDVFFEDEGFARGKDEVRTANGTQNYGWGIRFINTTPDAILRGLTVESCEISNVAHTGIKFTARERSIQDIRICNNTVLETGGPGVQIGSTIKGHVNHNDISASGSKDDPRKWGRGSGLWTWNCKEIIIEHNSFRNAKGPGDSAGCHIDFNCSDVIVQYNISENNAGGFCEILGNNHNCAYRYNVSINDGYRVKHKDGAFQEGKIFWLSGFVGKGKKRTGPFNSYFYNNTIYVRSDIEAKVAVDRASKGALLANNIFYFEGESKLVLGDQYKPDVEGLSELQNIVFKNNLFLKADNWPKEVMIQDEKPVFGDPQFVNAKGTSIEDYIPLNTNLIKDKGVVIEKIPGDAQGLFTGLAVEHDILGNAIVGNPDLGAIEIR